MRFKHDGQLDIAIGKNRMDKRWQNKEMLWSALVKKVTVTHRTAETHDEYMKLTQERQDNIKDIGGFVGGIINGGRRKKGSVVHRQLLTLDIDHAPNATELWESVSMLIGSAVVYSTHKHTTEKPRLRLLIPVDRPLNVDEYEAVARKVASWFDIEYFDSTTFQPTRLMYWPSTSKNGVFFSEYQDGPWIKADDVLAEYDDWQDSSQWPVSALVKKKVRSGIDKQVDPLEKSGLIGAFCRTYPISAAIEKWLPDIYIKTDIEDRYTYVSGSVANGLVVYDDKFAFSHHSTDPVSERLCNAWDLVRIHKFGKMDDKCDEDTLPNKYPSYVAMSDLAGMDKAVRRRIGEEKLEEARDIFQDEPLDADNSIKIKKTAANENWLEEMEVDRAGNYIATINNVVLVMENDPALAGCFRLNEFEHREEVAKDLPWRKLGKRDTYVTDADLASLRHYMEMIYSVTSIQKIDDALAIVMRRHKYHPIRDYLNSLEWDGIQRAERIWIDYLGAEDTQYVRTVSRKALLACVARVFEPGCKFDEMLTTIGDQGIGKSTIIRRLGGKWFSDSFTSVQGTQALEQLQGAWIIEMGELSAIKKAEIEQVKHFTAKQEDRFRVAYGRRVENFPRQCVFFPTTNTRHFLKDIENRRFWPIDTDIVTAKYNIFEDFTKQIVNQVWAEVMTWYMLGEELHLSKESKVLAKGAQSNHMEMDERLGALQVYLEQLVPDDWNDMNLYERRAWLQSDRDDIAVRGTVLREQVSAAEVWCELLGGTMKDMNTWNTKEVHNLLARIPGWHRAAMRRVPMYGRQWVYLKDKKSK